MTTQEFVKKEQISRKLNSIKLCLQAHPDNQPDSEFEDRIYDIEYIEQKLSAERERAGKLVECAERLLFLHGCEQEGISSGKPSFADWITATNNLQHEVDRFKSTDQDHTNPSS